MLGMESGDERTPPARFSTVLRDAQPATDLDAPYALCGRPQPSGLHPRPLAGFTLIEVMIAMAVFFIVVFAVLGMVVQSLGAARALQRPQPDFSILASALTLSNVLEEGVESGDFEDLGPEFRDWQWERQILEVGSNGLFQVDFFITRKGGGSKQVSESMSVLMYKPGGKRRR
jgi:prepilin-type N-terminal cleavage/methylation domain-containing protein